MNATPFLSCSLWLPALVLLTLFGDIWRTLLTPLLFGAALLFLLTAGRSMLQSRSERKQRDEERIEPSQPAPDLLQTCRTKVSSLRLKQQVFLPRRMPDNAPKAAPPMLVPASPEPPKKSIRPVLPLFAVPNDKPKEPFAWNETKEID